MSAYHFKVVAQVREDLSEGQRAFIEKEMALWQEKLQLEREGQIYYKARDWMILEQLQYFTAS